jgi:hypothetical protein
VRGRLGDKGRDVIHFLADNSFGDTRAGGLAGPTGLVVILLLVVSTIFLIRSMNKRLRKLPERFPMDAAAPAQEPGAAATPTDAAGDASPAENSPPSARSEQKTS